MDAYIAAIWSFGFNFAPYGWALCNGQILSISGNEALFALIGTTYGGNGTTTFGIPNLQGRTPIGTGQGPGLPNYVIGQAAGSETVTLTSSNLPVHNHPVLVAHVPVHSSVGDSADPTSHVFGVSNSAATAVYNSASTVTMAANNSTSGVNGSNIPLSIVNPFQTISFCIALFGIFPSRN